MTIPSLAIPSAPVLAAFTLASLLLAATPGPGVLYIVTRTLAQGRRAGLASVAGVALGNFGNAMGASLGLAALMAMSTLAFDIVRWAGAAYLVYLGVKALGHAPAQTAVASHGPRQWSCMLRDGALVALLNPKTALFFAAFLPQFIDTAGSTIAQSALLGCVFVLIAVCTDALYVLAAGLVAPLLKQMRGARSSGRYATAAVYFGLGIFAAFTGSRSAK